MTEEIQQFFTILRLANHEQPVAIRSSEIKAFLPCPRPNRKGLGTQIIVGRRGKIRVAETFDTVLGIVTEDLNNQIVLKGRE